MEKSNRTKIVRVVLAITFALVLIGGSVAFYLWSMPHLDVQAEDADYTLTASALAGEYLQDEKRANEKYLSADGNSKIFIVEGNIANVDMDWDNQLVLVLKDSVDRAGVRCVFTPSLNDSDITLKKGDRAKIKGILRAGASYDEDLGMYVDVLMEKCNIVTE